MKKSIIFSFILALWIMFILWISLRTADYAPVETKNLPKGASMVLSHTQSILQNPNNPCQTEEVSVQEMIFSVVIRNKGTPRRIS